MDNQKNEKKTATFPASVGEMLQLFDHLYPHVNANFLLWIKSLTNEERWKLGAYLMGIRKDENKCAAFCALSGDERRKLFLPESRDSA